MSEPRYLKIEDYHPWWESWTRETRIAIAFGKPVWTDGRILLWGDPPPNHEASELPSLADHQVEKVINKAEREGLYPLTPIGVLEESHFQYVVFDNRSVVDARFFVLINERFPAGIWMGDDSCATNVGNAFVVKVANETVAVVMPVRASSVNLAPLFQSAMFQSANAASPQPTNNPEESANT